MLAPAAVLPAVLLGLLAPAAFGSTGITAPPDVTMEAQWFFTNVDLGAPMVSVDPALAYDVSNNAPSLFQVGKTVVTWLVIDGTGIRATDEQVVTVRDTTPPVCAPVVPAEPHRVKPGGKVRLSVEPPAITDAADLSLDVTSSHKNPFRFGVGEHTVVFTAVDDSGNRAECPVPVSVIALSVENLTLAPTHDTIRASWDALEGHSSYRAVLRHNGTIVQSAVTNTNSHTFYDLDPGMEYHVKVHVKGNQRIDAQSRAVTLPPPLLITDDFADAGEWKHVRSAAKPGGHNNHAFSIDAKIGNPEPSARISGNGSDASSRIERWLDLGGVERDALHVKINYRSESDAPLYGQVLIRADGSDARYSRSLWMPAHGTGWLSNLGDAHGVLGDAGRVLVQLYLHVPRASEGAHAVYFDNLYVSPTRPPQEFKGGSSALTAEQDEFDRVLAGIMAGSIDPREYLDGPKSLGQYDPLLEDVLGAIDGAGALP